MQPSETVSRVGTDGIGRYRPYVVCCNDVSVKSSGEPVSVGFSLLAHMSVLPVHEAIKSDATCRGTIETFCRPVMSCMVLEWLLLLAATE